MIGHDVEIANLFIETFGIGYTQRMLPPIQLPTRPKPGDIDRGRNRLGEHPVILSDITAGIPLERLTRPSLNGGWSIHRQLVHLIYCEMVTSEAIVHALITDGVILPETHPERHLGRALRLDALEWPILIDLFRSRRAMLMQALIAKPMSAWDRTAIREGKRPQTIYQLARTMVTHEQEHLISIYSDLRGGDDE